jgi:hypothetical protein
MLGNDVAMQYGRSPELNPRVVAELCFQIPSIILLYPFSIIFCN